LITRPRWKLCACRNVLQEAASHDAKVNSSSHSERKNRKKEGAYIDKDGVARTFDRKKISRKRGNELMTVPSLLSVSFYPAHPELPDHLSKRLLLFFLDLLFHHWKFKKDMALVLALKWYRHAGGAIKGRGWKYGSGFVDGVSPVLSPMAQDILEFVQKGTDVAKIWESLDKIPPAHDLWDDIVNVAVQLRLNRQWEPIITVSPSSLAGNISLCLLASASMLTILFQIHQSKISRCLGCLFTCWLDS